ncbi:fumarylacetoacetate hydrolase family protein [Gimibacter soli]|uniref:Fumarylacetoacetate hydrolase family protein n=1 Tax=Gimibacter soli TaxID=3024400 RepID=A0AAE9XR44_9PROT|nr:fumarylacetoacetate hydrolase family protein [Gimibacter soli]WCL53350.1 fumarylacetoacetate hydrolase family protein [Gimibacter soli]
MTEASVFSPDIPVLGGGDLAAGRVFCVGRNYADHAAEMGDAVPEPPFFFIKPATCLVVRPATLSYPPRTADLQHEIELVVVIGKGGRDIARDRALEHVAGYATGVDMTRRDMQAEAKAKRRPWDMSKSFDEAAPISAITPAVAVPGIEQAALRLTVNGDVRQQGHVADMIWPVADIVAELSTYMALLPGDLIYTGTPAGVGPVARGDRVRAEIEGLEPLDFTIA